MQLENNGIPHYFEAKHTYTHNAIRKHAFFLRNRTEESGRASVGGGALGHLFCPRRSKRTRADEMGRLIGVALTEFASIISEAVRVGVAGPRSIVLTQ